MQHFQIPPKLGVQVKRKVFFSFHFAADFSRTWLVRNIGALEGNTLCNANRWEEVKRAGPNAIKKWIDNEMHGKSCVVVLIGTNTAYREWVQYEIVKGWNDGKGVLGVHIHGLRDLNSMVSLKGPSPFEQFHISNRPASQIIPVYDPQGFHSKQVYRNIAAALPAYIDHAINVRKQF